MMATQKSGSKTRTLTQSAYRAIRSDILKGHLVPGSKLRIDELRQRYGAGSSPVRESLSRLISEGLVTTEEQKGFRVAPVSAREFREITDLRLQLEMQALRRAIEVGDDEWEANIVAALHRLALAQERIKSGNASDIDDWEERNREFHDALVRACDSKWLLRLRAMLQDHSERYRRRSLEGTAARRNLHQEHENIHDAVIGRDAERACTLIQQHFERTYEVYEKSLQKERPSKAEPQVRRRKSAATADVTSS